MRGSWRRGSEAKISTACAYGNEQSSGITELLQQMPNELFRLTDFYGLH
ncbi:MAG: hypothetical protein N2V74_03770 [Candidatus Methanospirare jalkutatii]|nr:MAG: hypothetical protein N2V74_02090 [Candidatus Methanospirare jalkutatii]UYZ40823.1 MAG: hypothetical protein N2V74_03770 [Candidatus Methanospirare jalkutatii]